MYTDCTDKPLYTCTVVRMYRCTDNSFTNNFCKPHLAGILFAPVSDHLIQFCISKENKGTLQIIPQNTLKWKPLINPHSINNFRHAILKSKKYEKLKKKWILILIKLQNFIISPNRSKRKPYTKENSGFQ